MDSTYLFQSLVIVGSVKECKKWIELMHNKDKHHLFYRRESCGFVNFDVKLSSNEEQGPLSLQQISTTKILDKFRTAGLVKSDIEGLPTDLLAKIVDSVPLVIPSKNVTGSTPEGRVAAPYDLNFEERAALILAVKGLKPEWEEINLDRWEQRDAVLYYSLFNAHFLPSAAELRVLLMKNDIHVTIVARDCCDWDNIIHNYYTKIIVIENNEISFERMDLPQEIRAEDHPLIHKYGHLFKTWEDIWHEERIEFTSQTLGDFKQYWTNKVA